MMLLKYQLDNIILVSLLKIILYILQGQIKMEDQDNLLPQIRNYLEKLFLEIKVKLVRLAVEIDILQLLLKMDQSILGVIVKLQVSKILMAKMLQSEFLLSISTIIESSQLQQLLTSLLLYVIRVIYLLGVKDCLDCLILELHLWCLEYGKKLNNLLRKDMPKFRNSQLWTLHF